MFSQYTRYNDYCQTAERSCPYPCHPERSWSHSLTNGSAKSKDRYSLNTRSPNKAFLPAPRRPGNHCSHATYSLLINAATYPAPNPLSIFTTLTFEAHEFIIPNSAASPLNAAP